MAEFSMATVRAAMDKIINAPNTVQPLVLTESQARRLREGGCYISPDTIITPDRRDFGYSPRGKK